MALNYTSLFLDAARTQVMTNIQSSQDADGSDSPVDLLFYFACNNGSTKVQAKSDPGVDQIEISMVTAVNSWAAGPIVVDAIIQPTTPNGYKYRANDAGTLVTEPTWPTTIGATVTQDGVEFECIDEIHQANEVKLATSSAGLDTAVAGDPVQLGTTVNGNVSVPIYARVDQSVHHFGVFADLKFKSNDLVESAL